MQDKRWLRFIRLWFVMVALMVSIGVSILIRQHNLLVAERTKEPEEKEVLIAEPISDPQLPQVLVIEVEKPIEKIVYLESELETDLEFSDIDLIARVVWKEARGEDHIGKKLIADEVLNRYYSEDFPNTIEGIVIDLDNLNIRPYLS